MVKLSDLDLPVVYKNQLLFKSGKWNKYDISPSEVNSSVGNTKWNKINKSLIFSHKDKDAEAWVGRVENVYSKDGATYGDVHIYDPNTAIAVKHGEAPFAISAGIAWPEEHDQPTNFFYRNFSLVADPGVRNKEIFLNFSLGETIQGFKTANFSAVLSTESTSGSSMEQHTNLRSTRKAKKCKKCGFENEENDDNESDDKEEISKESKEHPELPADTIKQIVEDHEEKKADMACSPIENSEPKLEVKSKEANMAMAFHDVQTDVANEKQSNQMLNDVIATKLTTMTDTELLGNPIDKQSPEALAHINKDERRSNEMKIDNKDNDSSKKLEALEAKTANFEAEPAKEEAKPVESKEAQKELPSVPEKVNVANPMMDDKVVDDFAAKLSNKLLGSLKPASMTTQEFGSNVKNEEEEVVERLAKSLSR